MTIQLFSDNLRESLNKRIEELDNDRSDLIKLGQIVSLVRDAIIELKTFTASYSFSDDKEEISFFKLTKPEIAGLYFYYRKLFALAVFDSFRDKDARHRNYHLFLGKLERYALKNSQLYEYWITGSTDLDAQYFLRGKIAHRIVDVDDRFTTGYDIKFAKIMAYENLRKHIRSLLEIPQTLQGFSSTLTWTGQKSALIELIYALHSSHVVNKGNADIKLIAGLFESAFNISLGNFYRNFQDFKIRKANPTIFLDELKKNLIRRINESEN